MDSWASLPTNEHDLGCHEKIIWALLDFSSSQARFACMCHPTRRAFFCARAFNDIQFFFSHACLFVCLLAWLWLLWQISCAFGDGGFEDGLWQAKGGRGEYWLSLYVDEKGSEVLFIR